MYKLTPLELSSTLISGGSDTSPKTVYFDTIPGQPIIGWTTVLTGYEYEHQIHQGTFYDDEGIRDNYIDTPTYRLLPIYGV